MTIGHVAEGCAPATNRVSRGKGRKVSSRAHFYVYADGPLFKGYVWRKISIHSTDLH